jgi:hypothetical protein
MKDERLGDRVLCFQLLRNNEASMRVGMFNNLRSARVIGLSAFVFRLSTFNFHLLTLHSVKYFKLHPSIQLLMIIGDFLGDWLGAAETYGDDA